MHLRTWVITVVIAAAAFGALAGAALLAWPEAGFRLDGAALARVSLPGYAGRIVSAEVSLADGTGAPLEIRAGRLWPSQALPAGARVRIELTVHRPWWAGWLVGGSKRQSFTVRTPTVALLGRWIQVADDAPVTVAFNGPVGLVSLGGGPAQEIASPRAAVSTGQVADSAHSAGTIELAAAARAWEQLPPPVRVTWFAALSAPQVLAAPRPGLPLAPDGQLRLTFSLPVAEVLGGRLPQISPAIPGRWRLLDAHTLAFSASGEGFPLGTPVEVALARPVILAGRASAGATRTLGWQVPIGSTLRLQELLAQLGYLPLEWRPGGSGPRGARAELASALTAPTGHFRWRYPNTPPELQALWSPGQPNTITQGAVMSFEHDNDLTVDGIAGPEVWNHLIGDAISGKGYRSGYSYVYVHRSVPQSLNLWVDGQTILSSPGNTGVPAAPTALGTFPVFEHIPIGTMSGKNPDGTRYHDVGIRWISYFHRGEAIHSFNRASYGTPQSLGCVELPLAAAAAVWPHTPIGTLVTIEN